jgi:LEA14-like dessication related protein
MTTITRRAALGKAALLVLGLAGCANWSGTREPPDVGLADLRLVRVGLLEQTFAVVLRIRNLDPEPLDLTGARFVLSIAGQRIGVGTAKGEVTIAGLESGELPGEITVETTAWVDRLLSLSGTELEYDLDGVLFRPGGPLARVPFRKRGRLSLPEPGPA